MLPPTQRIGQSRHGFNAAQPVVEGNAYLRQFTVHASGQAAGGTHRDLRHIAQQYAQARLRPVVPPGIQARWIVAGDRRKTLAQHRLHRLFPTGFDLNLLPQRRRIGQRVTRQPFRQFALLGGFRLHLLQRGTTRFTGRQFALQALHLGLH